MKKFLFLTLIFAALVQVVAAQDLLVKRSGERLEVKVLEVGSREVRYKKASNLDGPAYVLPVSEIAYIQYANGERDVFAKTAEPATAKPVTTEPAATQPAVTQPAATTDVTYSVGDVYARDGVTGMVWQVEEGGRHGVLISFEEACLKWSILPKDQCVRIGLDNVYDGRANMATLEAYIADGKAKWSDFPAFEWCRNLGKGWYLPAINEVWTFGNVYCGGSREALKRPVRSMYNATLRAHGRGINNIMYYYSSTEQGALDARYSHFGLEKPYVNDSRKADALFVRAFYRF